MTTTSDDKMLKWRLNEAESERKKCFDDKKNSLIFNVLSIVKRKILFERVKIVLKRGKSSAFPHQNFPSSHPKAEAQNSTNKMKFLCKSTKFASRDFLDYRRKKKIIQRKLLVENFFVSRYADKNAFKCA